MFPFIIGPFAVRLAIGPISHALASAAITIAPPVTSSSSQEPEPVDEENAEPVDKSVLLRHQIHNTSSAPMPGLGDAGKATDAGLHPPPGVVIDAPSHGTIVVPAGVIAKAIEKKDVSASNATGPDGKPLGAKIHGASKYRAGLRDGDIIIFVAGTRTETTQAMVDAATRALGSGATSLKGKILRGDEIWDVVLELPRG